MSDSGRIIDKLLPNHIVVGDVAGQTGLGIDDLAPEFSDLDHLQLVTGYRRLLQGRSCADGMEGKHRPGRTGVKIPISGHTAAPRVRGER